MSARHIGCLLALLSAGCLGVEFEKVAESEYCTVAVSAASPPSCDGAAANTCGVNYADNCCSNTPTPCGEFLRGYDAVEFSDDGFPAFVSDFRLERYEVTVGRFRAFMDAGGPVLTSQVLPNDGDGAHVKFVNSGWRSIWNALLIEDIDDLETELDCSNNATWTDDPDNNETQPINCVSWYEAFAFCIWDGGRLATETEWDYAASGGSQQRVFPWSDPPISSGLTSQHAVFGCNKAEVTECPPDSTIAAVGSRDPTGVGLWSHSDLAGNVAEWVLDWKNWNETSTTYLDDCVDCVEFGAEVDWRAVKGGAFDTVPPDQPQLKTSANESYGVADRTDAIGFRCLRPL